MIGLLTNHLWQSTLFAGAAGLLALGFRKNRAEVRFWLWLSASIKFFVPFMLLMSLGTSLEWAPAAQKFVAQITAPAVSPAIVQITQPFPDTLPLAPGTETNADWALIALLSVWACGFAGVALMRLRGWLRVRAAVRTSKALDIPCLVQVRSAPGLLEPGVVGFLRPIILLPVGIVEQLTRPQLEAVLAHELCHVRRRDNLFASIHMAVEAIFWFHPLVWWVGARLVEERERACDEAVLSLGGEPRAYADGIVNVCKLYAESPLACVSGVSGANLRRRIEEIMKNSLKHKMNAPRKLALALAGLAAVAVPFAIGIANSPKATAQSRTFEVASIRLSDPNAPGRGVEQKGSIRELAGGRYTDLRAVYNYIAKALGLRNCPLLEGDCPYITGGPAWIRKDRYVIRATLPEGTPSTEAAIAPMLEALLRDRFQLKFHHEMREAPVYVLTVAKGGPKVKPTPPEGRMFQAKDGTMRRAQRFTGGGSRVGPDGRRMMKLTVENYSMPDAAKMLVLSLNRPVLDRTGLTGNFDWEVEYGADPDFGPMSAPEFFTAIQEQAGLRIEASKEKVDVIVIDSIERPSEN